MSASDSSSRLIIVLTFNPCQRRIPNVNFFHSDRTQNHSVLLKHTFPKRGNPPQRRKWRFWPRGELRNHWPVRYSKQRRPRNIFTQKITTVKQRETCKLLFALANQNTVFVPETCHVEWNANLWLVGHKRSEQGALIEGQMLYAVVCVIVL